MVFRRQIALELVLWMLLLPVQTSRWKLCRLTSIRRDAMTGPGFSISGGRGATLYRPGDDSVYVSWIRDGAPADREGKLRVGDRDLSDAVPLMMGQAFGGYVQMVDNGIARVTDTLPRLCELACGWTAVRTALNTRKGFAEKIAAKISELTELPFKTAPNKFEALAAHDTMAEVHGALNVLAAKLFENRQ